MPEIPGPPAGYDEEQQRIWFEGAAAVAKLQAHQWSIIADQYDRAAAGQPTGAESNVGEDVDAAVATADEEGDDADDEGCPECGGPIVESFGGSTCGSCGYTPEETDDA